MDLSVVIPTLNAARLLPAALTALGHAPDEVIVADGGSDDGTPDIAAALGARVITASRGRGTQLAAAIAVTQHAWVLLIHADTRLEPGWQVTASAFMAQGPQRAGYFRFALDSADPRARRLERLVAWRCRVLALPYGDQGLLLHRDLLGSIGGIPPIPLMEDVALVRRLGRDRLVALDAAAVTSAAKWEKGGWRLGSARNLVCLALYFAGIPPQAIARLY